MVGLTCCQSQWWKLARKWDCDVRLRWCDARRRATLVVYQWARFPHTIQNYNVQSIRYNNPSNYGGHIWRYCSALYVAVLKSTDWSQETVVLIFSEIYPRSSPKADRKMTVIITALVWFTFSKMLQKASYRIGSLRNLSRAFWVPLRIAELAILRFPMVNRPSKIRLGC